MELKRYLEVDSKTALEKIKSEHGEEALIISSDKAYTLLYSYKLVVRMAAVNGL